MVQVELINQKIKDLLHLQKFCKVKKFIYSNSQRFSIRTNFWKGEVSRQPDRSALAGLACYILIGCASSSSVIVSLFPPMGRKGSKNIKEKNILKKGRLRRGQKTNKERDETGRDVWCRLQSGEGSQQRSRMSSIPTTTPVSASFVVVVVVFVSLIALAQSSSSNNDSEVTLSLPEFWISAF